MRYLSVTKLVLSFLLCQPHCAFQIGPDFASNFIKRQLAMRKIKDLTVADIKDELRVLGEKVSGTRQVLAKRLQVARTGSKYIDDEASESGASVNNLDDVDEEGGDPAVTKQDSFIDDRDEQELVDTDNDAEVR